jgi:hypothetical protein
MRPADKYQTGADVITVAQGANLLASKILSKGALDVRYRRYYSAIDRAIKAGRLKALNRQKTLNAGTFFVWAREKYGWDCSYYAKKVKISASVSVQGVAAWGAAGADATVQSLPTDPQAREREIMRRLHFAELNERELKRLREELEAISQQKAERSQRAREAGSQGGRGKAK